MFSVLSQFDVIIIVPISFIYLYDLSFTNMSFFFIYICIIYIYICLISYVFCYFYSNFLNFLLEKYIFFIFNLFKQQLNSKNPIYFPYLFAIFNFILFSNFFSLFSGFFPLTSHFFILTFLSVSSCLGIFIIGILRNNLIFFKIFIPSVPFILIPLMILIELISYIIRAFSLSIRLCANIIAGHILVHVFSNFFSNMFFKLQLKTFSFFFNFIFLFFNFIIIFSLTFLELGVAILQAYVFTTLLSMYLSDSLFFKENLH